MPKPAVKGYILYPKIGITEYQAIYSAYFTKWQVPITKTLTNLSFYYFLSKRSVLLYILIMFIKDAILPVLLDFIYQAKYGEVL